jgi:hypothetical protein
MRTYAGRGVFMWAIFICLLGFTLSAFAPSRRLTLHHSPSTARLQQKMRSVSSGQFQWPMPLIGLTPLTASSIFLAAGRTRLPMFHARLL